MNDLGRDLYRTIVDAYCAVPAPQRRLSHWVMDAGWLGEARKIADAQGYPIWPSSDLLFGLPVVITEDGGIPHLEPDAVSRMVTTARDGSHDHGDGQ